jgi:thiamine pyrophosphate-dependent acetolactate synthase large subunit-like protein
MASLDFVNIEQQEARIIPFGVEFKNPNFAKVAEAMGAKGIRIETLATFGMDLLRPLPVKVAPSSWMP